MSRRKRTNHRTQLSEFLEILLADERITLTEAARIAGCKKSVLHAWITGSYPAEGVVYLARLCRHYRRSLTVALVGENLQGDPNYPNNDRFKPDQYS